MNSTTGTLYTGITGDLWGRVYQHKTKQMHGFTEKYDVNHLAYYEEYDCPEDAIVREKQIKRWRRSKKIELIKSMNPHWIDLAADWYGE